MGVEKVESGIAVSVLAGAPWVEEPVTELEVGGDGLTDDGLFDTVMVALLGAAGVTGEATPVDVKTPDVVEEDSEDVVEDTRIEEVTSGLDGPGEVGRDEDKDVIDTAEVVVVTDMSNAWRFALGARPLFGVRLGEGVANGSAHNIVELKRTVVVFVPFVWPNLADGIEVLVKDIPGGDEIELVASVSLTLTT